MIKKIILTTAAVLAVLACAFLAYKWLFPDEYSVGEDEIALYVQMDVREDFGLLVRDYNFNGHDYGGGISNADRSLLKKDDLIIDVWNREELKVPSDLSGSETELTFRIITEYTDPNYENIYPEDITRWLEPITWYAEFGKAYDVLITGDNENGYKATIKDHPEE